MKTNFPIAMTLAGSDPSAGAGIQADLKTFSALGIYGTSVITAITEQSTLGVRDCLVLESPWIQKQIQTLMEDLNPLFWKLGMLGSADNLLAIAELAQVYQPQMIVDPVLRSTSGKALSSQKMENLYLQVLCPISTLITPNIPESNQMLGIHITSLEGMKQAAHLFRAHGARNVLIKGGHLESETATDVLLLENGQLECLVSPKIISRNLHGTGCVLASSICAFLAQGQDLFSAVTQSKQFVFRKIQEAKEWKIGEGNGPFLR